MRTLAIDFGAKRTGLAMSDSGGTIASPLDVITHGDPAIVAKSIIPLVDREGIERIVIGVPLGADGSIGGNGKRIVEMGRAIAAETKLPVVFVDERLSTYAADQQLNAQKRLGAKMTRGMRKERLDAMAAAVFLQAFLDGELPPVDVDAVMSRRKKDERREDAGG
jgi:putative Holliday junction resolvase